MKYEKTPLLSAEYKHDELSIEINSELKTVEAPKVSEAKILFPLSRNLIGVNCKEGDTLEKIAFRGLSESLTGELNNIIDLEFARRKRQGARYTKRKKVMLAFLATSLAFAGSGYLIYYVIIQWKKAYSAERALDVRGNALYDLMKHVCSNVFLLANDTCTIVPNLSCRDGVDINCNLYDPYFINCDENAPHAPVLPQNPCTTSLYDRLANCNASLFSQYRLICHKAGNLIPIYFVGLIFAVMFSLMMCSFTRAVYSRFWQYTRDDMLDDRFSTLAPVQDTAENSVAYNRIIKHLNPDDTTVREMIHRIEDFFISSVPAKRADCLRFFREQKEQTNVSGMSENVITPFQTQSSLLP